MKSTVIYIDYMASNWGILRKDMKTSISDLLKIRSHSHLQGARITRIITVGPHVEFLTWITWYFGREAKSHLF